MAQTKVPPFVTELVLGGFWAASAIQVMGYTWESVSKTWSQLPPPGSGGGTAVAPPKAVQKADNALGVPNLDRNRSFTGQVAGVAASPIPNPTQGIAQKAASIVVNAGKSVISFLTP